MITHRCPNVLAGYELPNVNRCPGDLDRLRHRDLAGMTPRELAVERVRIERVLAASVREPRCRIYAPSPELFVSLSDWALERLERIADEIKSRRLAVAR